MRITQSAGYAIAAVTEIANRPAGEIVPCSAISEAGRMPERFVLQLLRKLVTEGVLASSRGVNGGYKLAKPANKTTLLEVIEAVDGPLGLYAQIELPGMPTGVASTVTSGIDASIAAARKQLASITIATLRFSKAA